MKEIITRDHILNDKLNLIKEEVEAALGVRLRDVEGEGYITAINRSFTFRPNKGWLICICPRVELVEGQWGGEQRWPTLDFNVWLASDTRYKASCAVPAECVVGEVIRLLSLR